MIYFESQIIALDFPSLSSLIPSFVHPSLLFFETLKQYMNIIIHIIPKWFPPWYQV